MTKKEKLKEIEIIKQQELELLNEYNFMVEETELEKTSIKDSIKELCSDKYYCGVYIRKEQAMEILQLFLSGTELIKMDSEIYEIEKEIDEVENVSTE